MDPNQKLELFNHSIQCLSEEKRNQFPDAKHDDAECQLALSRLRSELEMLKGEGALEQSEASSPTEKMIPSATEKTEKENVKDGEVVDEGCTGNDDIAKELKELKRQNFITHCLLSVMIVLTLTWQISEASLLLKVKDGLNHPFRAFGSLVTGMFKVPDVNGQGVGNKDDQSESSSLPSLTIPDMPRVDIPNLGSNNEE